MIFKIFHDIRDRVFHANARVQMWRGITKGYLETQSKYPSGSQYRKNVDHNLEVDRWRIYVLLSDLEEIREAQQELAERWWWWRLFHFRLARISVDTLKKDLESLWESFDVVDERFAVVKQRASILDEQEAQKMLACA